MLVIILHTIPKLVANPSGVRDNVPGRNARYQEEMPCKPIFIGDSVYARVWYVIRQTEYEQIVTYKRLL